MKKFIIALLVSTLFLSLCACSFLSRKPEDSHTFYYRKAEFAFGTKNSVIDSELRDITGHSGDLFYLITLYLAGPLDTNLISPFPASARLMSAEQVGTEVIITLTDSGSVLLDSEFSLACTCLALTCLELADTAQVTISYRNQIITLDRNDIVLFDISSHPQSNTEVMP